MPFKLEIQKTGATPYVLIDEEKKYMKFEGVSFHENVVDFFKDITKWLNTYLETDFGAFTFDCELVYFNSSTGKLLLNMFLDMDEVANAKNITVNWITTADNDIGVESGEDYAEDVKNITFNLMIK